MAIGIPMDYISDQNMRLKLYRRLADVRDEQELQIMLDEFKDRFGPPPLPVENLYFQMRVKLRAEACGLSAVSLEGEQIVLRYPPLPEGANRFMPNLGLGVRSGKNAYWIAVSSASPEWRVKLLDILAEIAGQWQPS
jgi:transcription-repair coupling factor (superfamily II helicase)